MTLSINKKHDTQHNVTQYYGSVFFSKCPLCCLSLVLSVTYKSFMLSIIMMHVVTLSVVMLSVMVPTKLLKKFLNLTFFFGVR
jgi:hypothetical protein